VVVGLRTVGQPWRAAHNDTRLADNDSVLMLGPTDTVEQFASR